MATNKKLDPALAETVERVLEDLMTRFEAAEEQLESRADLPAISPETEASLLREIEADLDLYYPLANERQADRSTSFKETAGEMIAWLRVSGTEALDRIAEIVLPSMPLAAAARSASAEPTSETESIADPDLLRDLKFVPVLFEEDRPGFYRLTLRYYGLAPAPGTAPDIMLILDGKALVPEIVANLPGPPAEVDVLWRSGSARLSQIGRSEHDVIVIELSSDETD